MVLRLDDVCPGIKLGMVQASRKYIPTNSIIKLKYSISSEDLSSVGLLKDLIVKGIESLEQNQIFKPEYL